MIDPNFILKLKKEYLYEDYKNLLVRIIALKKEENSFVLYLRIEYTLEEEKDHEILMSLNNGGILFQEIINEEVFINRFKKEEGSLYTNNDDFKFTFLTDIKFPLSFEEFNSKITLNQKIEKYVECVDDINLIYYDSLYNTEIDIGEFIGQTKDQSYNYDFFETKFVYNGRILNGMDLIEAITGISRMDITCPDIIIVFPIKSFKFDYSSHIIGNNKSIDIKWEINDNYKKITSVSYFIGDEEHLVNKREIHIAIENDFRGFIVFIILWEGDEKLLPKKTKLFWKGFDYIGRNLERIVKKIEDKKEEIEGLITKLQSEEDEKEKAKIAHDLHEKYRKLRIEYEYLGDLSEIRLKKESDNCKIKEFHYYKEFINYYEKSIGREEVDFSYYLKLNNLLYIQYLKDKQKILEEYHKQMRESSYITFFGPTAFNQLNEMSFNIDKATSNIIKRLKKALVEKNHFNLLNLFEILGDLYIHKSLLILISPERTGLLPHALYQVKFGLESYEKALESKNKIEIPGVGRGSINVGGYMSVFNNFINSSSERNIQGDLNEKIAYIKESFKIGKDSLKSSIKDYSELTIVNEDVYLAQSDKKFDTNLISKTIRDKLNEMKPSIQKWGKTIQDIHFFLSPFKSQDLQFAMVSILKKIYFRTIKQMKDDIIELIKNNVNDLKDVKCVLFQKARIKSNDLWAYLIPKYLDKKLKTINSNDLVEDMKKIGDDKDFFYLFLDDVIGTGNQFIKWFNEDLGENIDEIRQILCENEKIHLLIISGVGSLESKEIIRESIDIFKFNDIHYKKTIRAEDKAFFPKNFPNEIMLENLKEFLKSKHPKYWAGFEDCQYLVVCEWNTPNNTISCLWDEYGGWRPLFHRK